MRSLGYNAPTSVLLNLYKALVRSITEYSSPVWFPHRRMQLQAVERIRQNLTHFSLYYRVCSYSERCVSIFTHFKSYFAATRHKLKWVDI